VSQTRPRLAAQRSAGAREQRRECAAVPKPVAELPREPVLAVGAGSAKYAGHRHDIPAGPDPAGDDAVRIVAGSAIRAGANGAARAKRAASAATDRLRRRVGTGRDGLHER